MSKNKNITHIYFETILSKTNDVSFSKNEYNKVLNEIVILCEKHGFKANLRFFIRI
jgi:hypothetical protein